MGCAREKRPSEQTLDTVFRLVRSLDVEVWTGEKYRIEDVEENVCLIKRYLDEMVTQFKTEVKYVEPSKKECLPNNSKPFIEPPLYKSEWQLTPIIQTNKISNV